MSVGLWNIFQDNILNPVVYLDDEYKMVDFYNCKGKILGNNVIIEDDIMPYGFAFFTVSK